MRSALLTLFAATLLLSLTTAAAEPRVLPLDAGWKLRFVEDAPRGDQGQANGWEQPDFADADWDATDATAPMQRQGVAWYRRRVVLPESWRGKSLLLNLGRPDDGAAVYVNGTLLGQTDARTRALHLPVPADLLSYGEAAPVLIAVRLWNWHQAGGLHTPPLTLTPLEPKGATSAADAYWVLDLQATDGMPDGVLSEGRWEYGLRDEGTSDTRPNLRVLRDADGGRDALLMDVWYPNSREMLDFMLPTGKSGSDWAAGGASGGYLRFRYRTDSLDGDMTVRLNLGRLRWTSRVNSYIATFPVRPSPHWQEVILPFSAFALFNRRGEVDHTLSEIDGIQAVSIGYDNHRLQGPGQIAFMDFQVGAVPTTQPSRQPVSLAGVWTFRLDATRPDGTPSDFSKSGEEVANARDREGYGLELGWQAADFDDSAWHGIPVPATWEDHGYSYDGPAWYRTRVYVPEAWRGESLRLRLGRPDDRGSLYWNGELLETIPKFGKHFDIVLKPEQIRYGAENVIAAQIFDWYRGGGLGSGQFTLGPVETEARATLELAWDGEPASAAAPAAFEMGAKPPTRQVVVLARFILETDLPDGLWASYDFIDCFHRQIAAGRQAVTVSDGVATASITLSPEATRRLYYGEWFDSRLVLHDAAGRVVDVACVRDHRLQYGARDALTLPPLPPQMEDTPYGQLPLVDVIDCAADDGDTPHPYKEGGIRASWVGTRAYATWKEGVTIESLGDQKYREVNNNQFFGYRIGRGKLKPHTAYLLRLRVPDDKARYTVMDIKAGRNYQGTGYRSGYGEKDPWAGYPQSGEMQWYDHLVMLDDTTYGYRGARSTSAENGFWVFFHDNGRNYTALYEAGAGVAEMRLYEIADLAAHYPTIRYPEDLPHRTLMMDWERQPEAPPADAARWARFAGLNVISPVFQKWASHGFWHSDTGFAPPGWYRALPEDQDDRDTYQLWLDATRQVGINLMPRIEYGGGPKLPKDAWVIGPDGKVDPCGRYCRWGANILHEATWSEMERVLDELIGRKVAENPQLVGLLWRQRQDRIRPSYGPGDIAQFCAETGLTAPAGSVEGQAKWAATEVGEHYLAWWFRKRADFLRRMRDMLKSYRPDLTLAYYNWDKDGWRLGFDPNAHNSPQDWSDLYNVDRADVFWGRITEALHERPDADFVTMLQTMQPVNQRIFPSLFSADEDARYRRREIESAPTFDATLEVNALAADLRGSTGDIAVFAPVNGRYLADNEAYISYFETADGLAVCNIFDYEEKGRWNIQGDNYESSELTPGGRDFGMAEEVLAFFHGDPNVMTATTYTYGRGWLDKHRQFAQAFLALPDSRGEILAAAATPASPDLRVRRYAHSPRDFVSVVHRGVTARTVELRIPSTGTQVTDLVTGEPIPSQTVDDHVVFTVTIGPMELRSYLVAP